MKLEINCCTNNLANDLSKFLIGYLSQFDFNYYLGNEKCTLEDVFQSNGLLYLFLFNQKKFIKEYIDTLNKNNPSKYFVNIEFVHCEKSLLDFNINFFHNLFGDQPFYIDKTIYYDFITALGHTILCQTCISKNNNIHLDLLYIKVKNDLIIYISDSKIKAVSKQGFVPVKELILNTIPTKYFKTQSLDDITNLHLQNFSDKRKQYHEYLINKQYSIMEK